MNTNVDEVAGARQAPPQNLETKIALVRRLFPKVDAEPLAAKIASIDEAKDGRVILHFHEDDRLDVEPQKERVRQFGFGAQAKALGMAIADSTLARFFQHPDDDWGRAKSPSKPIKLAPLTRAECQAIAEKWQATGFTDISISKRGVLVEIESRSWLLDRGDEAMLQGDTSDKAITALMLKASRDWNNRIELIGTEDYKARAWKIAQATGVTVVGYEPPASLEIGGKNPHAEPENVPKVSQTELDQKQSNNVETQKVERPDVTKMTGKSVVTTIETGSTAIKSAPILALSDIMAAANDDSYDEAPFNDESPSI